MKRVYEFTPDEYRELIHRVQTNDFAGQGKLWKRVCIRLRINPATIEAIPGKATYFKALPMSDGRSLAQDGMQRAIYHAAAKHADWPTVAYNALVEFVAQATGPFKSEDVRKWAAHVPTPPDNRAWGGIFLRAAREGLIRRVGYAQASDPKQHSGTNTLWEAN